MSEVKADDSDRTNLNPSPASATPSPCDEGAGRGEVPENRPSSPRPSPPSEGGEGAAGPDALARGVAPRRRWNRIPVVSCAAVLLLFALSRLLDRQPDSQGRTVEQWLYQMLNSKRDPNGIDPMMALEAMGRDAVPYEIKVLARHDSTWQRMLRGMRAKAPGFVAELLPNRLHPDIARGAAEVALIHNPHTEEFAPQIVRLLDDSDPNVRLNAMAVLSAIAMSLDRSTVPALCRALKDPDYRIRSLAASTLGRMGATAQVAVPDLERALLDTNYNVRLTVVRAVSTIGGTNITHDRVLELF